MTISPATAQARANSGGLRPRGLVVMGPTHFGDLFDGPRLDRLRALADLRGPLPARGFDEVAVRDELAQAEVLITGWGSPPVTADVLGAAPRLRAVFHAGGSVKRHIDAAGWARGLVVTSAATANATPVAEFALATILLEGKRTWRYIQGYRAHRDGDDGWRRGIPPAINLGGTVGLVGLSRVGRRVAELLRPFDLTVLVADPTVADVEAAALDARLVPLDDLLREADIVSLHAPELPETRGLLDRRRLGLLRDGSVLINTARGALIDHDALVDACRSGRIRAVLDVTDPEPLPASSPLYDLPSVQLTPHIAGAMHGETHRLADSTLDDLERFTQGLPLRWAVDSVALDLLA
ncbi:hydroxyacid dehydrogenase [Agromyces sp. CFH 90414]|uniref:Hydroxyacid dehydrogenase n=1 Tax=Agromyces agglutinans TaxID=2662258 RepID=A0A6I2F4E4_9MICO|nr:hydroxyacid dehydrogenase [Agromyces agglutinans]MRG59224.1 hydroxyacid dehydrogenase [Agromyces agglutinans]